MQYIDTHSHLHFPQFDDDRAQVHARMKGQLVTTIAVGTGRATSKAAVQLAQRAPEVVVGATIGVHPTDYNEQFTDATYAPLLSEKVVAVGECGFDYFRTPREDVYETQKALFEAQIQFALTHNLPLMLHVRPSKKSSDAHDDAIALLQHYAQEAGDALRGTAHFFTGTLADAKKYWDMGFCTSFPGVITFAPEIHEVVAAAPIDLVLSETDAPYAAPKPYRGQRAEPLHVIEVVHEIARIRKVEVEVLALTLVENAKRVFLTSRF